MKHACGKRKMGQSPVVAPMLNERLQTMMLILILWSVPRKYKSMLMRKELGFWHTGSVGAGAPPPPPLAGGFVYTPVGAVSSGAVGACDPSLSSQP